MTALTVAGVAVAVAALAFCFMAWVALKADERDVIAEEELLQDHALADLEDQRRDEWERSR